MFTLDRNSLCTDNENFFNYISDFNDGLRNGIIFELKVCSFVLNYLSTNYMHIIRNRTKVTI